jgi:hypothetical protein
LSKILLHNLTLTIILFFYIQSGVDVYLNSFLPNHPFTSPSTLRPVCLPNVLANQKKISIKK